MKRSWFEQYLSIEHGIPSHDTFGRVFSLIDPEQFQVCFSNWIKGIVKTVTGDVIAIDGKFLRRSHDNQLTLGQVKADEKPNEITALPALLENLDITGAIIITDGLNTQKNSAKTIVEKGHGRIEEREVTSCNDIEWLTKEHEYPYLGSIVSVKLRRFHKAEWSEETRYFVSSVKNNDAERFSHYVRAHWGVENNLHWTLDMAFDEDSCRIRKGFADQNMAIFL
jgi:predicted transposase YbfD/YdcC